MSWKFLAFSLGDSRGNEPLYAEILSVHCLGILKVSVQFLLRDTLYIILLHFLFYESINYFVNIKCYALFVGVSN